MRLPDIMGCIRIRQSFIQNIRQNTSIIRHEVDIGFNIQLTKNERREIAHVLHNACMIDGIKINVMSAIDIMVESLKRIILGQSDEKLMLLRILPIESLEGITE